MTEMGFFEEVWKSVSSGDPMTVIGFVCAVVFFGYVLYAVYLVIRYVCRGVKSFVQTLLIPIYCEHCDEEASDIDDHGNPCCEGCLNNPPKHQAITYDQLLVLDPGEINPDWVDIDRDDYLDDEDC